MLDLFKLQEKKITVHQPSYLTKPAGLATRGTGWEEGAPLGRWLGTRKGKGRETGTPRWEGADCPTGRGAKGTSEEGVGGDRLVLLSTRAQCWRGLRATTCPPLASGESAPHAWALGTLSPTGNTDVSLPPRRGPPSWSPPLQDLGLSYSSVPSHLLQPPHLGARAAREGQGGQWV